MKKLLNLSAAIIAALVSFSSCQKVNEIEEAPKVTHTVKFTTETPTKTSYVINGTTVSYQWEDDDLSRLHVYEDGVEGEINVEESEIYETYVKLTVTFEGDGTGPHTYTANLNEGVISSNQIAAVKYDSRCDVLVAKPVSSEEITDGIYTFRFRRPAALAELNLKGLNPEEEVRKVTIFSDKPLVGTYIQDATDDTAGTWNETSNKIVVTFGAGVSKIVDEEGVLKTYIVSMPVESASVKVLVETESGLKYRKVTSAALTLKENNVKSQGIGLTQVTEAVHEEDGWYLVTDANELFDGDEIRIASPAKGMIAGEFAVDPEKGTQDYLAAYAATFTPETYDEITGVDSENKPNTFTLVENYGSFALVNENGKLGTTAVKKMSYDDGLTEYTGVTEWTIAIDNENLATISAGETYGRILYNHNNGTNSRFLNYAFTTQTNAGMLLPQIYKKYGTPEDPIIKTARTASFNPEEATVTIDANDNVFPTLSFEPAEATEGEQTWTSSNTEVATVDESGNITLVSDGTTTIKVEIAESDTYQPCSAEYVLTVKPAEVEGVDYLDRAWTSVSDGATSYSSWTGKTGSKSGNTYAGNSAGSNNSIQLRVTNSNSGIVVTNSASNKVAKKITVDWNTVTLSGRTIDIYGKSTAYTNASDLYSYDKQGTKLGSIKYGENEPIELEITGDYEFIGIRSNSNALYLNWIKIQWEDAKPEYNLSFWDNMAEETITEYYATVETPGVSLISNIVLRKDGKNVFANSYESSNTDVAEVDDSGRVTLKKKGDAIITATLNGDETHKTTKVSYTIHVANKLSSIKLAEDSEQPTTFYVGQDFSFAGIKVEATYNDGEEKTLTADDLNAENFSGFDSSAAVESQTITVSYTDGATKTTTYNVEIKPLVTLYGITVPAEDANGNSITVKGGLTEAAEGDEIELDVNLNTEKGYKLTSLKVNEVEHSADVAEGKYTFTMPAEAVTVTAEFSNLYTVTLGSATNGSFTVNGQSTGSLSIAYGTTVNLVATPSTGYVFKTWTVEGATVASATATTTSFAMPANDVTVNAEFELKSVKPGTYSIATNNSLWGTNYDGTAAGCTTVSGSQNDISITLNKDSCNNAMYINNSQTRAYSGNTMVFSVPEGYVITAIAFTADGNNWGGTHTASSGTMTDNKNWKGSANSVTISFGGSCRMTSVSVTYYKEGEVPAVDASWSVNPSSVSVKVGEDKTATITTDYNGTLSVTSNDTGIATATISGKIITVTGVAEGSTTLTVTGAATTAFNAINKTIDVTVTAATTPALTYSFTISPSDFTTGGYAANNGDHNFTATCTTDPTKTMSVTCTTNQVYQNSSKMQWKKSEGYIYNKTNLGTIKSVTVNSTGGNFTTNYGTTEHPTSETTVGNGYFTVKVGSTTGYTTSIVVTFTAD